MGNSENPAGARSLPLRARIALLLLICSASPADASPPAQASHGTSPCRIAEVEGVEITRRDAEELSALLQPGPDPAAASRLALDVAIAQRLLRGWLVPSSARARLESYRELLADLRRAGATWGDLGRRAHAFVEAGRERLSVALGPCYASLAEVPAAEPALVEDLPPRLRGALRTGGPAAARTPGDARLARLNEEHPLAHVVHVYLPASTGVASDPRFPVRYVDLGWIAPYEVAAPFGEAAFALREGEVSGPVETRLGLHLIRVLARYEPGTLEPGERASGVSASVSPAGR